MVELVDTSDLNPDGQLAVRVRVSLGGQIKWMYVTSPLGADRMLFYNDCNKRRFEPYCIHNALFETLFIKYKMGLE